MSDLLHRLSALGWGWVAAFLVIDGVAVACAGIALRRKSRRTALRAFALSLGLTFLSFCTMGAAVTVGIGSANAVVATPTDSSTKAAALADGISTAMNGAAFGILFSAVAGVAALVCVVSALAYRNEPRATVADRPG